MISTPESPPQMAMAHRTILPDTLPLKSWVALSWQGHKFVRDQNGSVLGIMPVPRPEADFPLRKAICFYGCGGNTLALEQAPAFYHSLEDSPFISTYAASNPTFALISFIASSSKWWKRRRADLISTLKHLSAIINMYKHKELDMKSVPYPIDCHQSIVPAENSHPAASAKSILDALPHELILESLDYLLPHEQLQFAQASKTARSLSNLSVARLVPPSAQVTHSRSLEWTFTFRALSAEMQNALEKTSGLLPCPDIFSPIDESVQALHIALASARQYAIEGNAALMESELVDVKMYAEKASVPLPDTGEVERVGYTAAVRVDLEKARTASEAGDAQVMESMLYHVKVYAEKAGIPLPETRAIERDGYSRAMVVMLKRAHEHANARDVWYMDARLSDAAKFAWKAGIPLPDTNEIERIGDPGRAQPPRGRFSARLRHLRK
jgi:hypothetical protein